MPPFQQVAQIVAHTYHIQQCDIDSDTPGSLEKFLGVVGQAHDSMLAS